MSLRGYARSRGYAPSTVREALVAGRIHRDANGRIDPEQADRDWANNTDWSKAPLDERHRARTESDDYPWRIWFALQDQFDPWLMLERVAPTLVGKSAREIRKILGAEIEKGYDLMSAYLEKHYGRYMS